MAKDKPLRIIVIVDRSGSMLSIAGDMEGALNSFVKEQRKQKGKTRWTYWRFNQGVERVFSKKKGREVPSFTLQPEGMTALYDAIGKAVNVDDVDRKTVCVIVTDGAENSSREFTHANIVKLIQDREAAGWQFVFLGANQDSFAVSQGLGMRFAAVADFSPTGQSVARTARSMSNTVAAYASAGEAEASYTDLRDGSDTDSETADSSA